ncbi:hypothetical protein [Ottowia thiooxydans]|uniref:Uncharacterized protein n=1 Tax=Ottowia thiooxydans TaxID=219182 RepID=A0ABV2Q7E2_9BURK
MNSALCKAFPTALGTVVLKRCLCGLGLLWLLFAWQAFAAPAQPASDSWEVVGAPGFSAGPAGFTSLAFGPDGRPYVAFVDMAQGDKASVMRLNIAGTAWEAVGRSGFSEGGVHGTSLAFGPDGKPYVAYQDGAHGGKASVMRLNSAGTAWESVGGAGFSVGVASDTSLAFGPDGRPYVVFMDHGLRGKASVMRLNGSSTAWEPVGGGGLSARAAVFTSLAFSPDGTPYVAYVDTAHGGKASVMRLDRAGTAWETVGGAGFSESEMIHPSLAFGRDGRPYVAYGAGANGQKSGVMRLNNSGTAWEAVSGTRFPAGSIGFISLAFGPDGKPYVAFIDVAHGYKASAMRLNNVGGAWETLGGTGFSVGEATYTSLAFGPDGKPYVAYRDEAKGGKATVMRSTAPAWAY